MAQIVDKKVTMSLVGLNGNAFVLMAAFQKNAKKQGWSQDEIDLVLGECQKSEYDKLLSILIEHTEEPDEEQ